MSAARASRSNGACRLIVRAQQQQPSKPAVQQQVASQVLAAGLALGISLTAVPVVAPQPAVAASQYSSLGAAVGAVDPGRAVDYAWTEGLVSGRGKGCTVLTRLLGAVGSRPTVASSC